MPRLPPTFLHTLTRSLPLRLPLTRLPLSLPTRSFSLLTSRPTTLAASHSPILTRLPTLTSLRWKGTYGSEYQPSQRKRKRKHGFLVRLRRSGKNGVAMLTRRKMAGRRFLSH